MEGRMALEPPCQGSEPCFWHVGNHTANRKEHLEQCALHSSSMLEDCGANLSTPLARRRRYQVEEEEADRRAKAHQRALEAQLDQQALVLPGIPRLQRWKGWLWYLDV